MGHKRMPHFGLMCLPTIPKLFPRLRLSAIVSWLVTLGDSRLTITTQPESSSHTLRHCRVNFKPPAHQPANQPFCGIDPKSIHPSWQDVYRAAVGESNSLISFFSTWFPFVFSITPRLTFLERFHNDSHQFPRWEHVCLASWLLHQEPSDTFHDSSWLISNRERTRLHSSAHTYPHNTVLQNGHTCPSWVFDWNPRVLMKVLFSVNNSLLLGIAVEITIDLLLLLVFTESVSVLYEVLNWLGMYVCTYVQTTKKRHQSLYVNVVTRTNW